MEISKAIFMKNILFYVRVLEIVTFILANFIIACIFYLLLNPFNRWILLIYFSSFIISLLILKNNWFFLFFKSKAVDESIRDGSTNEPERNNETERPNETMNVSWKTIFFVFFKQFFFNISYELFPLLIIWIGWFGIWYIFINLFGGFFSYEGFLKSGVYDYYINLELFKFHSTKDFFQVMTILGLLLGVYEFYLSRQEQKVLSKIKFYTDTIKRIIFNETTFEKFFLFISPRFNTAFIQWISTHTDPKLSYLTLLKEIRSDPEAWEGMMNLIYPKRFDRRFRDKPVINLQLVYKDSIQKFETIESRAGSDGYETMLKNSYDDFFTENEQIENLMTEIRKEINLNEFNVLLLSNINIIQEIAPEFIGQGLNKTIGDIFGSFDESTLFDECITSADYREALVLLIMHRIVK